ncbi:hypothetical protein D3C72_1995170 [compost metagenome]
MHRGAVGRQVGHDGGAQVGIDHDAAACGALGGQPRQVDGSVTRVERQRAGAHQLQRGQGGAAIAQTCGGHGTVCHAFAVEGVVGMTMCIEVDHGQ